MNSKLILIEKVLETEILILVTRKNVNVQAHARVWSRGTTTDHLSSVARDVQGLFIGIVENWNREEMDLKVKSVWRDGGKVLCRRDLKTCDCLL